MPIIAMHPKWNVNPRHQVRCTGICVAFPETKRLRVVFDFNNNLGRQFAACKTEKSERLTMSLSNAQLPSENLKKKRLVTFHYTGRLYNRESPI